MRIRCLDLFAHTGFELQLPDRDSGPDENADPIEMFRLLDIWLAVGQNQWYHFGVGAPPILVYFSGDWDVYWRVRDFDPWPY